MISLWRLQRLPDNLDQTTLTAGQQGDEGQVLGGDYEFFRVVVRSPLAPFCSIADNADDLYQEIGSLIPTDGVHKDKVTWELQPSLKAALWYCSKIAQRVDCSDDTSETPLCDPPSSQNSKFKFFTPNNVLGKEHYRLKVNQSSDYQPSLPVRIFRSGAKDKVTQYTMSSQNVLHIWKNL